MIKNRILTEKAIGVINKKIKGERLTQQDSNYLSRFVRPKLRDMVSIDAKLLLKKLEYNPKVSAVERKIKKIILKNIKRVDSIIICGSAVQTNYKQYGDIDVIVATENATTNSLREKNKLIALIEETGKKQGIALDVQIYSKKSILSQYSSSPSLIYQLKDSKIIYGKLVIPKKIKLTSLDLKMKLDWSEGIDIYSDASEIYHAIRNAMLVLLLINKRVNNEQLRESLETLLGNNLVVKLKNNHASKEEKKLALSYLNLLIKNLETQLNNAKWEKIELENP